MIIGRIKFKPKLTVNVKVTQMSLNGKADILESVNSFLMWFLFYNENDLSYLIFIFILSI